MGAFEVRCLFALASSLREWRSRMERQGFRASTMKVLRTATESFTIRRLSIQVENPPSALSA
jgi:hypothetical protein